MIFDKKIEIHFQRLLEKCEKMFQEDPLIKNTKIFQKV